MESLCRNILFLGLPFLYNVMQTTAHVNNSDKASTAGLEVQRTSLILTYILIHYHSHY